MDQIRLNQIREVLDYDKNINAMVFKIEKNNAGLSTENLLPYTQLNAEVTDSVSTTVNQLLVLLEKKKSELHTYKNSNYAVIGMKKASVNELGSIDEVLRLYNTAAEPYLGMKTSLTQATKGQILSTIRKIMPSVTYIVNNLRDVLQNLGDLDPNARNTAAGRTGTNADIVNSEYPKLVRGFVAYVMILHQLTSGNIVPISRSDFNNEIKFYIENITDPDIRTTFNFPGFNFDKEFITDSGDPYFGAVLESEQIRQQMNQPPPISPGVPPPPAPVYADPQPPPPQPQQVIINPPPVVDMNDNFRRLIEIGQEVIMTGAYNPGFVQAFFGRLTALVQRRQGVIPTRIRTERYPNFDLYIGEFRTYTNRNPPGSSYTIIQNLNGNARLWISFSRWLLSYQEGEDHLTSWNEFEDEFNAFMADGGELWRWW
jgi:hypothetical protein